MIGGQVVSIILLAPQCPASLEAVWNLGNCFILAKATEVSVEHAVTVVHEMYFVHNTWCKLLIFIGSLVKRCFSGVQIVLAKIGKEWQQMLNSLKVNNIIY